MKLSFAVGATERTQAKPYLLFFHAKPFWNFCQICILQQFTIALILFLPLFCMVVSSYVSKK